MDGSVSVNIAMTCKFDLRSSDLDHDYKSVLHENQIGYYIFKRQGGAIKVHCLWVGWLIRKVSTQVATLLHSSVLLRREFYRPCSSMGRAARGIMDNALDLGSEHCGFESRRVLCRFKSCHGQTFYRCSWCVV